MQKLKVNLLVAGFMLSAPAASQTAERPMQFFEGTTISEGTMKIVFKRPSRTRSINEGRIDPNGTLILVQNVEDEGKAPHKRHWRIRQTGPTSYFGTMSEAVSPVEIEQVGERFRFRFSVKGGIKVEQWLTPPANGKAARSSITARKLGIVVGRSEATIRKINDDVSWQR